MSEQRIGKYIVKSELGRGAMGVVYKAVDPVIGRTVAIKTIRFDLLSDPEQRDEAQRRFVREAQSAGGLSHPNIVTIYDVGESEGMTFIAMEFVEGESLESLLAAGVRWDVPSAARFGVQMAEALDLAHRKGIVHRDIKPGNILVDAEGRPHIVDFGIARIASSSMTQTNMVMGTPYYMSPEQVAGRPVDHRADIFALGAVLYEMLTREKAFPGEGLTTVIYKIMNENPVPVRSFRDDIPAGISSIIQKALAKDPNARYRSCRELIADFHPFLPGPGAISVAAAQTVVAPAPIKARFRKSKERPAAPAVSPIPTMIAPPADAGVTETVSRDGGGAAAEARAGRVAVEAAVLRERAGEADAVAAPQGGTGEAYAVADKTRKKLLLVVGLMMVLIAVIGTVLYFSLRKPAPAVGPQGASFNVVFADKAVQETPAPAETVESKPASGTDVRTEAAPPETKTEPPHPVTANPVTADRAEANPPGTKTETAGKESINPLGGLPEVRLPPVSTKEERAPAEASSKKSGTRLPRLVRQIDPVYPEDALRDRIDGDVTLNLTIGFSGRVERSVVVKSIPKLDAAAVAAAKQWEFEPGLLEGIPIQATLQVTIHFTLPAESVLRKTVDGSVAKNEPPPPISKMKPVEKQPIVPQDDVSRARNLLDRGMAVEALAAAKRLLAANPGLSEAMAIALDAVILLAPGEIKSLLDQYALSFRAGGPAEFFRLHARADVYDRLRGDLEMMMSAARDLQVSVSGLNLDFQMARYPEFQVRAVFSQILTGIPSAKVYREVLFEGRYSWILERRDNDWIITVVRVE